MSSASPDLLFALVARGKVVLAEYTSQSGNFTTVTRMLLPRFPTEDGRLSYMYDKYMFHLWREDNILFLCMTTVEAKRRVAFGFLDTIKEKFFAQYRDLAQTAIAFGMQSQFAPELRRTMEHFNNPSTDRFSRVRGEIAEVKSVMVQNIDTLLERSEKIELLVDQTEALTHNTVNFERNAHRLKNKMWWRNAKMNLIIAAIVITVIGVIALIIYLAEKK